MTQNNQYTLNKSLLLNWLCSADKELPIEELGKWIEAKTNGQYMLVKNSKVTLKPLDRAMVK